VKEGWEKKKLRDVCELINGRAYSKPELLSEGKYPVLRVGNFFTNNHWYYSDMELDTDKYCDDGDLLYAWSASFGPRIWTGGKVIFHYHIWKVRPDADQIDKDFLYYFFKWDTDQIKADQGTGTTMTHVSKGSMEDRVIYVPPLPEQQRIVALLDDAFDGIATAKANAEQNLKNARELFESHLQAVFTQRGEGWVERPLGDCIKVRSGEFLPSKSMEKCGRIDVYGGNGVAGKHDHHNLSGENIIIGRVGAKCGNVRYVNGEIWLTDNAFYVSEYFCNFDFNFLSWLLQISNLRATANQAAQPVISYSTIKKIPLVFPESQQQQRAIAMRFDELVVEVKRLETIYQQKLAALDELKKSLLHKAFSGEL